MRLPSSFFAEPISFIYNITANGRCVCGGIPDLFCRCIRASGTRSLCADWVCDFRYFRQKHEWKRRRRRKNEIAKKVMSDVSEGQVHLAYVSFPPFKRYICERIACSRQIRWPTDRPTNSVIVCACVCDLHSNDRIRLKFDFTTILSKSIATTWSNAVSCRTVGTIL